VSADEIVAIATCSSDSQIPGNNPIKLDDIPLLLIDGESIRSETLARLSISMTVSQFFEDDQEPQIVQCLPEDDGGTTTVVEIAPLMLSPIPQNLRTAFSMVSSQLDVVFGMRLLGCAQAEEEGVVPSTIPVTLRGATLTDEGFKWTKRLKRILTGAQVQTLKVLVLCGICTRVRSFNDRLGILNRETNSTS